MNWGYKYPILFNIFNIFTYQQTKGFCLVHHQCNPLYYTFCKYKTFTEVSVKLTRAPKFNVCDISAGGDDDDTIVCGNYKLQWWRRRRWWGNKSKRATKIQYKEISCSKLLCVIPMTTWSYKIEIVYFTVNFMSSINFK